jgi:hypothetical protein
MPDSGTIRQAVFDHQTHSQGDNSVSIMASGGCQIRQVDAEVKATGLATVLGVADVQVAGAVTVRAAQVVQDALPHAVARTAPSAVRTTTSPVAPRALLDKRLGQILNTGNAFGAVRDIFSRWHRSLSSAGKG